MSALAPGFIAELLSRTDAVEVIGRYVKLKKGGVNFLGLCPFHQEKSPSFTVSPVKQFYHCFGCGAGGDVIAFLMQHTGVAFMDAIKDLAAAAGMVVPVMALNQQEREQQALHKQHQQQLSQCLSQAATAYRQWLKESPEAIAYLKGRGLTGVIAQRFALGYAPVGWRRLSHVFDDYANPLLVEAGLVIESESQSQSEPQVPSTSQEAGRRYDRFRHRIMFPIRQTTGQVIGFGGRVLDQSLPKYLNSPETPLFSKGHELYGLFEGMSAIRKQGFCLVTEGYMDVVALAQHGFEHAVATLGTACTTHHLQKLFRLTEHLVFAFDGDAAGQKAAQRALEVALPYATDVRQMQFLHLPAEHDPDSFVREKGLEAWHLAIQEAMPLSQFFIQTVQQGCDLGTPEGQARMMAQAHPLWKQLPDGLLRRQMLSQLCDHSGMNERDVMQHWLLHTPTPTPTPSHPIHHTPHPTNTNTHTTSRPAFQRTNPHYRPERGIISKQDTMIGLLLAHSTAFEDLSCHDLELLQALDEPHRSLLSWLEAQWHEHGPQPWAVLQQALKAYPQWAFAEQQVAHVTLAQDPDAELAELREVMSRLRIDHWKAQCNHLVTQIELHPEAIAHYRALQIKIRNEQQLLNS